MHTKTTLLILIAISLCGCIDIQETTFICAEDDSRIVLRGDGTYTVMLTGACTYSGDYHIINDALVLDYRVAGTTGSFVLRIENNTLIDPGGYRWNNTQTP